MRYGVILLTHGEAPYLAETVRSFTEMVTPAPVWAGCVVDGGQTATLPPLIHREIWEIVWHGRSLGFGEACRTGWRMAREALHQHALDYIFWLENDFRFTRRVQLRSLARALSFDDERLAQMSLMRQPVNAVEIAAGSVIAANPEAFVKEWDWLTQTTYWTTNPSLIPWWVFDRYEWRGQDGQDEAEQR